MPISSSFLYEIFQFRQSKAFRKSRKTADTLSLFSQCSVIKPRRSEIAVFIDFFLNPYVLIKRMNIIIINNLFKYVVCSAIPSTSLSSQL